MKQSLPNMQNLVTNEWVYSELYYFIVRPNKMVKIQRWFWFVFWCLTPLSAIFQLYHGD